MSRLEQVRQRVDVILRSQPDVEEQRCGFVHLYGVSQACGLLALKRGLDVELGAALSLQHGLDTNAQGPAPAESDSARVGLGYRR